MNIQFALLKGSNLFDSTTYFKGISDVTFKTRVTSQANKVSQQTNTGKNTKKLAGILASVMLILIVINCGFAKYKV
ncbi:hypothetical protein ACSFB8_11565 [Enterococcus faecalis]